MRQPAVHSNVCAAPRRPRCCDPVPGLAPALLLSCCHCVCVLSVLLSQPDFERPRHLLPTAAFRQQLESQLPSASGQIQHGSPAAAPAEQAASNRDGPRQQSICSRPSFRAGQGPAGMHLRGPSASSSVDCKRAHMHHTGTAKTQRSANPSHSLQKLLHLAQLPQQCRHMAA